MQHQRFFRLSGVGGSPSRLGPLESRVMDVLWDLEGWATVSDVMAKMQYAQGEKRFAYSTIKTIMQNLADKRHLRKKPAGKANVFKPAIARETFEHVLVGEVVRPLLRGQRHPLLVHIAGELAMHEESFAEFERLLAEKRAERSHG